MIKFKAATKKVSALKKAKGPRGRKPKHSDFLKIRIEPELLEQLDKAAKNEGVDRSAWAREAFHSRLNRKD